MRIDGKGLIDRTKPVRFRFDGKDYAGYKGDTLASALLANDVRLVGRSFKYHRPRGRADGGVGGAERAGRGDRRDEPDPERAGDGAGGVRGAGDAEARTGWGRCASTCWR